MHIVDDFLDDFDMLREYCDHLDYAGTVNPFDGVEYPGITQELPVMVALEVEAKAREQLGRDLDCLHFVRLTTRSDEVPYAAHDDLCMADVLLLIYLNRDEHCKGGTELVRHAELGFDEAPIPAELMPVWQRDTNNPEAWDATDSAAMKPNRAVFIPAARLHRAAHPSGFGSSAHDGRLVYSCFARYL